MDQLPLDSHWAMRSHMAALERLIPAPEVLPADGGGGVATGRALVPTAMTRVTGRWVTTEVSHFLLLTLPSTLVTRQVATFAPSAPFWTTLLWPLKRLESDFLETGAAIGTVV